MASDEERMGVQRELGKLNEGQHALAGSLDRMREDIANWQVLHRQDHNDLQKDIAHLKEKPTLSGKDLTKIVSVGTATATLVATCISAIYAIIV